MVVLARSTTGWENRLDSRGRGGPRETVHSGELLLLRRAETARALSRRSRLGGRRHGGLGRPILLAYERPILLTGLGIDLTVRGVLLPQRTDAPCALLGPSSHLESIDGRGRAAAERRLDPPLPTRPLGAERFRRGFGGLVDEVPAADSVDSAGEEG